MRRKTEKKIEEGGWKCREEIGMGRGEKEMDGWGIKVWSWNSGPQGDATLEAVLM